MPWGGGAVEVGTALRGLAEQKFQGALLLLSARAVLLLEWSLESISSRRFFFLGL